MIEIACRRNLLAASRALARATGVSLGQISRKFYGHRDFLRAFAVAQKSITLTKYDEMLQALREAWPEGTPWPRMEVIVIPRPRPARKKISSGEKANRLHATNHADGPGR